MPEYDFGGQVAFVTGAARGQGRSHAQYYAKHGADVVVTDIGRNMEPVPYDMGTTDELEETASLVEDEGQEALAIEMDVRDEGQVEGAVGEALEEFGRIDFLANNAGHWPMADLTEVDEAQWDAVVDTLLKGVWLPSKHVGQHFIKRGGGGKIISTSSTAGLVAGPGAGHYTAAKHGVLGLTKTLALELAEYDVNVNAVCPTALDSPGMRNFIESYGEEMLEEAGEFSGPMNVFEPGEMIEPHDVSEAYMWLSSDAARYVTGIALPVDAGMTAK